MADQGRAPSHRIIVGFDYSGALGDHVTLEVLGGDPDDVLRVPFDQVRSVAEAMIGVLDEEQTPAMTGRGQTVDVSEPEHVPLDLSLRFNAGERPQCWTCGLPWPESCACSGVPNDEQLAMMLEDPDSWPYALAHEVRRLRGLPDDASGGAE